MQTPFYVRREGGWAARDQIVPPGAASPMVYLPRRLVCGRGGTVDAADSKSVLSTLRRFITVK